MEQMAVEGLVASLWQLENFMTRTRLPVRVPGGYSDIDVVGVDAAGYVRFAECKVRGPARAVMVPEGDFAQWLEQRDWSGSLRNFQSIWTELPEWLPLRRDTKSFEFWLVANLWFPSPKAHKEAETSLTRVVRVAAPHGLRARSVARVVTTRDLVLRALEKVRDRTIDDGWGRRYGDPVLDTLREVVRFTNPRPSGGGRVSHRIAEETREQLLAALGFSSPASEPIP